MMQPYIFLRQRNPCDTKFNGGDIMSETNLNLILEAIFTILNAETTSEDVAA